MVFYMESSNYKACLLFSIFLISLMLIVDQNAEAITAVNSTSANFTRFDDEDPDVNDDDDIDDIFSFEITTNTSDDSLLLVAYSLRDTSQKAPTIELDTVSTCDSGKPLSLIKDSTAVNATRSPGALTALYNFTMINYAAATYHICVQANSDVDRFVAATAAIFTKVDLKDPFGIPETDVGCNDTDERRDFCPHSIDGKIPKIITIDDLGKEDGAFAAITIPFARTANSDHIYVNEGNINSEVLSREGRSATAIVCNKEGSHQFHWRPHDNEESSLNGRAHAISAVRINGIANDSSDCESIVIPIPPIIREITESIGISDFVSVKKISAPVHHTINLVDSIGISDFVFSSVPSTQEFIEIVATMSHYEDDTKDAYEFSYNSDSTEHSFLMVGMAYRDSVNDDPITTMKLITDGVRCDGPSVQLEKYTENKYDRVGTEIHYLVFDAFLSQIQTKLICIDVDETIQAFASFTALELTGVNLNNPFNSLNITNYELSPFEVDVVNPGNCDDNTAFAIISDKGVRVSNLSRIENELSYQIFDNGFTATAFVDRIKDGNHLFTWTGHNESTTLTGVEINRVGHGDANENCLKLNDSVGISDSILTDISTNGTPVPVPVPVPEPIPQPVNQVQTKSSGSSGGSSGGGGGSSSTSVSQMGKIAQWLSTPEHFKIGVRTLIALNYVDLEMSQIRDPPAWFYQVSQYWSNEEITNEEMFAALNYILK